MALSPGSNDMGSFGLDMDLSLISIKMARSGSVSSLETGIVAASIGSNPEAMR